MPLWRKLSLAAKVTLVVGVIAIFDFLSFWFGDHNRGVAALFAAIAVVGMAYVYFSIRYQTAKFRRQDEQERTVP